MAPFYISVTKKLPHYSSSYFAANCVTRANCISILLKANSSAQRFKVTSQLRCLQEECGSDSSGEKRSSAADEERGAVAAASEPAGVNVHICDVNQEDFTLEDL